MSHRPRLIHMGSHATVLVIALHRSQAPRRPAVFYTKALIGSKGDGC